MLDSAGHNAHLERPDLTAALVNDWLAPDKRVCHVDVPSCGRGGMSLTGLFAVHRLRVTI